MGVRGEMGLFCVPMKTHFSHSDRAEEKIE